jgi:hypothetical protein
MEGGSWGVWRIVRILGGTAVNQMQVDDRRCLFVSKGIELPPPVLYDLAHISTIIKVPSRPHPVSSQSHFIDGHKGTVVSESVQAPEKVLQSVTSYVAVWFVSPFAPCCARYQGVWVGMHFPRVTCRAKPR